MSKVKKEKKNPNAARQEQPFVFRHRLGIRIGAGAMVAVFVLGSALAYRVQIRESGLEYVGTVLQYASEVTQENTGYLSEGTLERAWRVLRTAIFRPHTYEEYDTYASLCIARGDYEKATVYMQGCIDTWEGTDDSELANLWLRQGSLYTLCEDYETAVGCYDQALSLNDSLADAYLLRAQMRSELGDEDGAVEDLISYEAYAGDNTVIEAALGDLYLANEQYEEAYECYTKAIDAGGYELETLVSRGRCSVLMGENEAGLEDLDRYIDEGGTDSDGSIYALIGVCRMEEENYSGAIEAFRCAILRNYEDPDTLYQQIVICGYAAGDYESVEEYGTLAIEDALQNEETDSDTLAELYQWVGLSEFMLSDYESASASLQSALDLDETRDALRYYLGVSLMALERWDEAADAFASAVGAADTPEDVQYYLGCCLIQTEDYEGAHDAFLLSSELEGYATSSLYNAGICSIALEEYDRAEDELEDAVEADDDDELIDSVQELLDELREYNG